MERKGELATGWVIALAILTLLIGGLVGYAAAPVKVEEKIVEKKVEIPAKCPEVKPTECGVTVDDLLATAIEDFLKELDDEDELECDGDNYDLEEVKVSRVYDEYTIEYVDDDEYEVIAKVKLNFKQEDEKRCREIYDFKVLYEEDEEPVVTIL